MGDGLALGLAPRRTPVTGHRRAPHRLPAAIVLLSDGASTRGADPIDGRPARRRSSRSRSTRSRSAPRTARSTTQDGSRRRCRPTRDAADDRADDRRALLHRARRATRARASTRTSARGFSTRKEKQEVTAAFAGGALVLLLAGGIVALLRGRGGCREPRAPRSARHRARAHARAPGPGPGPAAVLRSLDLAVLRRVESLVPGEHLTPQVGAGTELAMIRPYQPGDDVRHIDWNVTARMREPHVRVHVGERAMTAWLVLDVSASMTFGTADRRKADVAEGVALAIGHVATRRGNRLGVVAFGGGAPRVMRPRQGRLGLLALLPSCAPSPRPTAPARPRSATRRAGRRARAQPRARRRRLRLPRRARLGGPAARAARPPRRARGRGPRPARARAAADGRPLARRSRDRPPAEVNTSRRGGASASPRRPRPSARRSPPRSGARAPTTSCCPPRVTGCARWPGTCGARRCGCAAAAEGAAA